MGRLEAMLPGREVVESGEGVSQSREQQQYAWGSHQSAEPRTLEWAACLDLVS